MTDTQKRIAELEAKAAEFKLIADLATDPEARANNMRRAQALYDLIDRRLRQQSPPRLRPSASAVAELPTAPLAARWALQVVLSSSSNPSAGRFGRSASKISSHQPRRHQRRQR